jgi:hypothetical protein
MQRERLGMRDELFDETSAKHRGRSAEIISRLKNTVD